MQVFLDDFTNYGITSNHLSLLEKCFKWCQQMGINLNPKKCLFGVKSGIMFEHVVSKKGLLMEPQKIASILKVATPRNTKELVSLGLCNFIDIMSRVL